MMPQIRETEIQKAILEYLRYNGFFVWRNNVGSGFNTNPDGKQYFTRFGFKGLSDIIGLTKDGRFLAIEVKKPGMKPTESQQWFLDNVKKNGGVAFVATSIDDVQENLQIGTKRLL